MATKNSEDISLRGCSSYAHREKYAIIFFKRLFVAQQTLTFAWERQLASHRHRGYICYLAWLFRQNWPNGPAMKLNRVANAKWLGGSIHAISVIYHIDRAVPMTLIEHDPAVADSQQLHAVGVLEKSRVCTTFLVDSRRIIQRYNTAHIVGAIIADDSYKTRQLASYMVCRVLFGSTV